MSNIGDGFKNIFLAGIGALAYTGEKGKEIIDQLVEKGEITLDQGRELNEELQRKATDVTANLRDTALEARMKTMTAEQREEFIKAVQRIAEEQNEADAAKAVEVEAEVVEGAATDVAEAVASVAEAVASAAEAVASSAGATVNAVVDAVADSVSKPEADPAEPAQEAGDEDAEA